MNEYLVHFVIILVYVSLWFLVAAKFKRNDLADVAWGLGFVLLAWSSWFRGQQHSIGLVTTILVTLWGIRLAYHIFIRLLNKPEDYRYATWRKEWKFVYLRSYLQVFLLQGILLYMVGLAFVSLNLSDIYSVNPTLLTSGIILWVVGYYFEVVGDRQLKEFSSNPENKGKLLTSGLWKFTRHPNYFGEVTLWWGIGVISLSATGNPLLLLSALLITYLIIFVSGIPLLEKKYQNRQDFQEYSKRTSVFFPLPPKESV